MKYALYGAGRTGRVHGRILLDLGQEIVCVGDVRDGASAKMRGMLSLDCNTRLSASEILKNKSSKIEQYQAVISDNEFKLHIEVGNY